MKPLGLLGGILAAALVGLMAWNQHQLSQLRREVATLRDGLTAIPSAPAQETVAATPPPSLQPELLAIRSEIAALSRRLDSGGSLRPGKTPPEVSAAQGGGKAATKSARPGFAEWSQLPAPVMDSIRQQLGDTPVEGAYVKTAGDQSFYSLEARLSDQRLMELVVNGEGQVVARTLETPLESLPARIQEQVAGEIGDVPLRRVAEVFEDGRTVYRVNAKGPQQAVQLMFSTDGDLLQADVVRREVKP